MQYPKHDPRYKKGANIFYADFICYIYQTIKNNMMEVKISTVLTILFVILVFYINSKSKKK